MTDSISDVPHSTSRWQDLAALVFIAALVLLFFWRIITPRLADRAIFPPGDFSDQFWTFRIYEARAFAEGRLPLWSDNFNSGHPFLADVQSAVFYPVSLIWTLAVVALRGPNFTLLDLEIEAIFHFVLAGALTYLFARRLIGSRMAAVVSAITFMLGGYLTSYPPQQLAILETATWLPLALLLIDLATSTDGLISISEGAKQFPTTQPETPALAVSATVASVRKPCLAMPNGYYVAAGLVLGVAALAGHPQTFLFVVYVCAIYFGWCVLRAGWRWAKAFAAALLPFGLTLLVAAGIAAAQWIPTLEYQSVSTRAAISWAEASGGFPTIDPLQMILPGFTSAFQSPLYIGVLPLWFAAFALIIDRRREKIFWALFALGSLLVAFGAYVFVYALFYLLVPGFAMFRDQERLAFIVSFALSIVAGFGFRQVIQPRLDAKRARRAWGLLPAGFTITAMMAFALFIAGAQRASGRLAFLTDRAGLMVLLFGLASILVLWRVSTSNRSSIQVFAALAIALIAFDLLTVNNPAYNASPDPRYPVTPIIQTIQSDPGIFRVVDEGKLPGHFGIAYGLEEIGGISPLRVARYDDLLDLAPEKLWPLLNVQYVITGRPGFANADVVMADGDTRLLRLKNAMPRAWLIGSAQVANDGQTLAAMQNDSFDPRATAYVTDALPFPVSGGFAAGVVFSIREPEHIAIQLTAATDELLVMSEVYYPGWRATVDGVETPILRADYAFRAVPVRAGSHRVEMVFDPWSVKIGVAVTLLTFIALVIGMIVSCKISK